MYKYLLKNRYEIYLMFIFFNLESIVINILCRAWARNIVHKKDGVNRGSVHFELMID